MINDPCPIMEYRPRMGRELRRYKRELMRMAEPVLPRDKSWQVIALYIIVPVMFAGAFLAWWNGLV